MQQAQITLSKNGLSIHASGDELKDILSKIPPESILEISVNAAQDALEVASTLAVEGYRVDFSKEPVEGVETSKGESKAKRLTKEQKEQIDTYAKSVSSDQISEVLGIQVSQVEYYRNKKEKAK